MGHGGPGGTGVTPPRQPALLRLMKAVQGISPLRRAGHLVRQAMIRAALYPVWLTRRADQGRLRSVEADGGGAGGAPDAELDVDRLNEAAERYFVEFPDREYLLDKPFSDRRSFARNLFDVGVLVHWLRLEPGDVVVELGAGTCWLSQLLNRFGCKTVSIDVSATALDLGREVFLRDPRTDWSLEPRFLSYDGHTLPLPDGSCDRVVIHDAFHHIPNPERILAEMARILAPHGIVAMCEPGAHHSETGDSRREAETGVLERDVVVDELARMAKANGFARATFVPLDLADSIEMPAEDLDQFLRGRGFIRYWTELSNGVASGHYLLLYKSEDVADTRRPDRLRARIEVLGSRERLVVAPGERCRLDLRITNRGNTRWLAAGPEGWTRLGVHLDGPHGADGVADFDWLRVDLPADLEPRGSVELTVELPPVDRPGDYDLTFDMVVEDRAWFEELGSEVTRLPLRVQ